MDFHGSEILRKTRTAKCVDRQPTDTQHVRSLWPPATEEIVRNGRNWFAVLEDFAHLSGWGKLQMPIPAHSVQIEVDRIASTGVTCRQ